MDLLPILDDVQQKLTWTLAVMVLWVGVVGGQSELRLLIGNVR